MDLQLCTLFCSPQATFSNHPFVMLSKCSMTYFFFLQLFQSKLVSFFLTHPLMSCTYYLLVHWNKVKSHETREQNTNYPHAWVLSTFSCLIEKQDLLDRKWYRFQTCLDTWKSINLWSKRYEHSEIMPVWERKSKISSYSRRIVSCWQRLVFLYSFIK